MTRTKAEYKHKAEVLESVIQDIWWMARRYAYGRMTYSPSMYCDAIRRAQSVGLVFNPVNDKESIWA